LEDRLAFSFAAWGQYSFAEFSQMPGPDARYGFPSLQTADFNADGWADLITLEPQDHGTYYLGSVYLSRWDGSFGDPQTFDPGPAPQWIVAGDFELFADGLPDFAILNSIYDPASETNTDVWYVYGNIGPGVSVTEYTYVAEGDNGTAYATFGLGLEYATNVDVTIHYTTAEERPDATATPGSDYIPTSGSVTIPAGETSSMFTVPVVSDRLPEPTETFLVWVHASGTRYLAYGVILDDDNAPRITVGDATVTEGNAGTRAATFPVNLSAAGSEPITVAYATGNDTATAGSDYQAASGTLTFAPGEMEKTITVPVKGDRLAEPSETFVVNLSNPTNATIADGQGIGTIVDDEPRISITDVTKKEGKKNQTTLFTFTVTLSAAYDQPVTTSFRTANGTARTSDNDYVAKTGTLTFAPGQTTKTITIEIKGDSKREAHETFYLDLSNNSSNSLFTKSRGLGTIRNDDFSFVDPTLPKYLCFISKPLS
jgi:chitinase